MPGDKLRQDVDRLTNVMTKTYKDQLVKRAHDPRRLRAVYGSRFLRSAPTSQLRSVVAAACQVTSSPGGTLTLLDADQQRVIIDHRASDHEVFPYPTPDYELPMSICMHTLMLPPGAALSLPDTTQDGRVCTTTIVVEGGLRAYLGVPLLTDGYVIGSLCVFDDKPRDWSDMHVMMLTTLASEAIALSTQVP